MSAVQFHLLFVYLFLGLHCCLGEGKGPSSRLPSLPRKKGGVKETVKNFEKGVFNSKYVTDMYNHGLRRLTRNAKTDQCRAAIEVEYMTYMRSISEEKPFPFENFYFHSQCDTLGRDGGKPLMAVGMKKYPPRPRVNPPPLPNNATEKSPDDISILYVLLMHENPEFAQRLLRELDEPQHTFVVHVDLSSTEAFESMVDFQKSLSMKGNLHILDKAHGREACTWGGFSIVNATLNSMRYAFELGVNFDYMLDISGSTYPLVDNYAIRKALSKKPGFTYMDVHTRMNVPSPELWQSFVECDGALHRIARLSPARGVTMHTGSQWFALPWHVVHWFLHNELPKSYTNYAKRVVVSDEHYFSTLFQNSPYCEERVSLSNVFHIFDKWENKKNVNRADRDPRKCLLPDPDHCGRSPTILTMEYRKLLQASKQLFARKFDPNNESSLRLLDEIDKWRADPSLRKGSGNQRFMIRREKQNIASTDNNNSNNTADAQSESTSSPKVDLCMRLNIHDPKPMVAGACNASDPTQWFEFGECTGTQEQLDILNILEHRCGMGTSIDTTSADQEGNQQGSFSLSLISTEGTQSIEGDNACQLVASPYGTSSYEVDELTLQQRLNAKVEKCVDISGESKKSGAALIGWECTGHWNQLFHYGTDCTLRATLPDFLAELRGPDTNVTKCVSLSSKNMLRTSECPAPPEYHGEDMNMGPDPVGSSAATLGSSLRWRLLPENGKEWKQYIFNSTAADAAAATSEEETDEEL